MGKLIVFDGIDASGKETQSRRAYELLKSEGREVMYLSFPDYGDESSALVRMYLNGGFGSDPGVVNAYAASSFYAVDRYASYMRKWRAFYEKPGAVIIADRYTTANAIHQLGKLPREGWAAFLDWLWDYEFGKLALPKPDLVLFFDMHLDVARRLLDSRCAREGAVKDIHEADPAHLAASREAALFAAEYLGWTSVKAYKQGSGGPVHEERDELNGRIMAIIRGIL